jgi:Flp pilus assembly protein TadB
MSTFYKSTRSSGLAKILLSLLVRADLTIKLGELLLLQGLSAVLGFLITLALFNEHSKALIGLTIGMVLPMGYTWCRAWMRFRAFNNQFDFALLILGTSLRAGYSLLQGIDAVSQSLPPPISDEFKTILIEHQCGIPLEQSLQDILHRLPSNDLKKLVFTIIIQREVGGDIASAIDRLYFARLERILSGKENWLSTVRDAIEIIARPLAIVALNIVLLQDISIILRIARLGAWLVALAVLFVLSIDVARTLAATIVINIHRLLFTVEECFSKLKMRSYYTLFLSLAGKIARSYSTFISALCFQSLNEEYLEFCHHNGAISLQEFKYSAKLSQRVVVPFIRKAVEYARRFALCSIVKQTRLQLDLSGHPNIPATRFLLSQVLSGLISLVLIFAIVKPISLQSWIYSLAFSGLAFYTPKIWLLQQMSRYKRKVLQELPDVLDWLNICMEAGMDFYSSIITLSAKVDNEATQILANISREIEAGRTLAEVVERASASIDLQEFKMLLGLIMYSHELGGEVVNLTEKIADRLRRQLSVKELSGRISIGFLILLLFQVLFQVGELALSR